MTKSHFTKFTPALVINAGGAATGASGGVTAIAWLIFDSGLAILAFGRP